MSQTVWPLNENGEIVLSDGIGSGKVVGYLNQDVLPSSSDGSVPVSYRSRLVSQNAYVDFTTQGDGIPSGKLDTGQDVDFTFAAGGRYPIISGGKLVVNNQSSAGSGGLADYYQSDIGEPVTRVGVTFTMPTGVDNGEGNMTYAAWNGIYEGGGTNVPRSWAHISIIPGTGATGTAKWFVCNGTGNLFVIKQQTFTNPAADGITEWVSEAFLDAAAGKAYAWLPDGSLMSVSDSDIAYMCGVLGIPSFKFIDLESSVIMCEHFCSSLASTAKFAEFKSLWGGTSIRTPQRHEVTYQTPLDEVKRISTLNSAVPSPQLYVLHYPSTQLTVATTTSATNVDSSNVKFSVIVGKSGKVNVTVSAYYEFSVADTLFWRIAGSTNSPSRAAMVAPSGAKCLVSQVIEISGLTSGSTYTGTLQHWSLSSGGATIKVGGSGSNSTPPVTFVVTTA